MTLPANSLDNSDVGKSLLEAIRNKQNFDNGESAFKQALMKRVLTHNANKGINPQKALDSNFFNTMTLTEKINFLKDHRDHLKTEPKFGWKRVGGDSLLSGLLTGVSTASHQMITHGGPPNNLPAIGIATALGMLVGGGISYGREQKDYNKDLSTQRNIDDAISALVDRSLRNVPTRVDYVQKIRTGLEEMPINVGKNLSNIDYSGQPQE